MKAKDIEYRGLIGAANIRMEEEESKTFIKMIMCEADRKGEPLSGERLRMLDEMDEGALAIFRNRLEAIVNATDKYLEHWQEICSPELMLAVLAFKTSDTPGSAVLWAYTIGLMRAELGRQVTLSDFAKFYFPWGIPTREAQKVAWEAQMGEDYPRGNYLDSMDSWQELADAIIGEGVPA